MRRTASSQCLVVAVLVICAALPPPALARGKRHHRPARAVARAMPSPTPVEPPSQPPLDDLYRRRGYGVGGPVFGGDTALAGSCADLRFAQPASCGRGYGIYGNGLGTRFGF